MLDREKTEGAAVFAARIKESLRESQFDGSLQTRIDAQRRDHEFRLMSHLWYLEVNIAQLRAAIESRDPSLEAAALANIAARMNSLSTSDRDWIDEFLPDRDIPGNLRFVLSHYGTAKLQ
jgi:hypothetical protein